MQNAPILSLMCPSRSNAHAPQVLEGLPVEARLVPEGPVAVLKLADGAGKKRSRAKMCPAWRRSEVPYSAVSVHARARGSLQLN